VTVQRQLRLSARRRVAFHLNSRRRVEPPRKSGSARLAMPAHEGAMSPKGPRFIAAKG
jgi:hypothetical protein